MEKCVEFRNVGCSYFPQSRVDCHYTISSQHTWASNDWVGLFKVGSPHPSTKSPPISMHCNTLWMLFSSGGLVIGEGLSHICLGAGPTQLWTGHRGQLLRAVPGYESTCFYTVVHTWQRRLIGSVYKSYSWKYNCSELCGDLTTHTSKSIISSDASVCSVKYAV